MYPRIPIISVIIVSTDFGYVTGYISWIHKECCMANRTVFLLTDRQAKLAQKTIPGGGVKGLTLIGRQSQEGL